MKRILVVVAAMALAVAMAPPASAGQLLSTTVTASSASLDSCISGVLSGASVAKRTVAVDGPGALTARLDAPSGDWDLAVFDAAGRRVAGSTFFGANE